MNSYLLKHEFCGGEITSPPHTGLGLVIVIPCFNEPHLLKTLDSLAACTLPKCKTEVIVVINSPENSSIEIRRQTNTSIEEFKEWTKRNDYPELKFLCIIKDNLPAKDAGVGLARKIGMDEGVRRFEMAGNSKGVLVCLDSDCTVSVNYLCALETHFLRHPETTGCSIYFEHPIIGKDYPPQVYQGIVHYELFLRYYKIGLNYSGFPFAFHTIGSSMAVRTKIYQQQGGMNKRKAGEDFYFLSKIFPLGCFTELFEASVFPSPRPSDRVPFGTGKAIWKWLEEGSDSLMTYHQKSFTDLGELFSIVPDIYEMNSSQTNQLLQSLSPSLLAFLIEQNFESKCQEIRTNVSSKAQFTNRFYRWFNNFIVLKFIHFAREKFYRKMEIVTAAKELLKMKGIAVVDSVSATELLQIFREIERNNKAVLF